MKVPKRPEVFVYLSIPVVIAMGKARMKPRKIMEGWLLQLKTYAAERMGLLLGTVRTEHRRF